MIMNDNINPPSYNEFIERLKIEFSDFIRTAESGRTVRHASLKARKRSIKIRSLLKMYREVALENDKRITKIFNEAKMRLREDLD